MEINFNLKYKIWGKYQNLRACLKGIKLCYDYELIKTNANDQNNVFR